MNYNEYNSQLNLSDDLYEKTLAGVKSGISKHNQIQKRKKSAFLSFAACFTVLVISVSAVKNFNRNSTANISESTSNTATGDSNVSAKENRTIKINTEETKYPHKIIIDNKIYSQYYFGDEKADTNNNIELKQSEIGELVCELDYSNLTDDLSTFAAMTVEEAKNNKFYKATVYKYAKSTSDNLIIVKAGNEYYIFYLDGLTTEYTINELLNVYTAKGTNEITGIEVWQNELYDYTIELPEAENITGQDVRPLLKATIKDPKAIQAIVNIISKNNNNVSTDSTDNKNSLTNENQIMSENGEYELHLIFADGHELNLDKNSLDIFIKKDYFYFNICNKGNLVLYKLNNTEYHKLAKLIEASMI